MIARSLQLLNQAGGAKQRIICTLAYRRFSFVGWKENCEMIVVASNEAGWKIVSQPRVPWGNQILGP